MQRINLILIFIAVFSCKQNDVEPNRLASNLNKDFEIVINQDIYLKNTLSVDDFVFKVSEITDSRCPSDVDCVQFGWVDVIGEVKDSETNQAVTLTFCLGYCKKAATGMLEQDTIPFKLNEKNYRAILKAVIPFPTTSNTDLPKSA
ncbi:MAG: hypothetical protein AAGI07_12705, partial [Bacteroidota bacterium]